MSLSFLRDDARAGEERLPALYAGQLFHDAATPASSELAGFLAECLGDAFPESDPRDSTLPRAEAFRRLTALRGALLDDPHPRALVSRLLLALGWDLETTYFDLPRLRAIPSGGHLDPMLRDAYHVHRDLWYANPPAQVNLWIAIHAVSPEEAPSFWPEAFGAPVPNDSDLFDYRQWRAQGGWQVPRAGKRYPTASVKPDFARALRTACAAGEVLSFSGAHLHGTTPHASGRTRYSCDLRLVSLPDVLRWQPRLNGDNRSTGTTLRDFLRASDLSPFPEEIAAAHEASSPWPPGLNIAAHELWSEARRASPSGDDLQRGDASALGDEVVHGGRDPVASR